MHRDAQQWQRMDRLAHKILRLLWRLEPEEAQAVFGTSHQCSTCTLASFADATPVTKPGAISPAPRWINIKEQTIPHQRILPYSLNPVYRGWERSVNNRRGGNQGT